MNTTCVNKRHHRFQNGKCYNCGQKHYDIIDRLEAENRKLRSYLKPHYTDKRIEEALLEGG